MISVYFLLLNDQTTYHLFFNCARNRKIHDDIKLTPWCFIQEMRRRICVTSPNQLYIRFLQSQTKYLCCTFFCKLYEASVIRSFMEHLLYKYRDIFFFAAKFFDSRRHAYGLDECLESFDTFHCSQLRVLVVHLASPYSCSVLTELIYVVVHNELHPCRVYYCQTCSVCAVIET